MTAFFLLLTLLAMQVIGAGLLYHLRQYYLTMTRQQLAGAATMVADQASALLGPGVGLQQLRATIAGPLPPPVDGALLVDTSGQVIDATGLSRKVSNAFLPRGELEAATAGRTSTALVRADGGETQIWAAAPVRVGSRIVGVILVEGSAGQIYDIILHIRSILLTWTLVALALSGVLSFVMARTVTGPIEALTERARAMATGDFAGRLPVRGRDEVSQLAAVFNHLARRLQETLDEIRGEQRRADAILRNMTDGLLALDAAGRVLLCNPAAAAMLEVDATAIAGRFVGDIVPAALVKALSPQAEADAPARGASAEVVPPTRSLTDPASVVREDGVSARAPVTDPSIALPTGVPVAVHGRKLLAFVAPLVEAGARLGTVAVLHDVTASERLEAERKEFVANVSHDLRTPLTTIRLYAESILEWGLSEPEVARTQLQVVVEEADRMARLIDDLLYLTQLDVQGPPRRLRQVDLVVLCAAVLERFQERARQTGILLTFEPSPEPVLAWADEDRIVRVVANLVSNALDFTGPGGTVGVSVTQGATGAEVRVRDTGVGIPASDLKRVFERFYRVDPSRSREHGGSGLGLAIAREIVEAHGGQIEAISDGHGSTFRFTLPTAGDLTG
jgi:two-component system sensor histidine kinase VicK